MSRRRQLLAYLASRLLLLPVMLWLIASLVFLLLRVAPGDPIDALLGTRAPEAARAALRHQLGLDQSLASQYGHYLWDLLHGQLGTSLTNQESVLSVIGRTRRFFGRMRTRSRMTHELEAREAAAEKGEKS